MEPMYFKEGLNRAEAVADLKARVEAKYIEKYREFYNVSGDVYLTSCNSNSN
jgi:hypothetical protein